MYQSGCIWGKINCSRHVRGSLKQNKRFTGDGIVEKPNGMVRWSPKAGSHCHPYRGGTRRGGSLDPRCWGHLRGVGHGHRVRHVVLEPQMLFEVVGVSPPPVPLYATKPSWKLVGKGAWGMYFLVR